jgi:ribulose-5-phosphate 4-epimerase/fuculose-1-phosphate aldolase
MRNRILLMCRRAVTALAVLTVGTAVADRPGVAQTSAAGDQAAIDELVLISRMLASSEMGVLGAYGHVSVRNRRDPSHYFISRMVSPGIVTPGDIYESDLEGKPVGGARPDLIEDRFLHGEIYKARPDVMAIVYTSAPELAAFSVSSVPLSWNSNPMKVFDQRKISGGQNGFVNTPALGRALADSLGRGDAVLVFGHGAVVVSSTTNDLVNGAVRLEQEALEQQFATALGGTPNHVAFTRKATPETRTNLRTGSVERVDRFSIFFNYLGARDLARIPNAKAAPAADTDQAIIDELVVANRLLAATELGVLTPDGLAHVSVRTA